MGYAASKLGRVRIKSQSDWGTPAGSWADSHTIDVEAIIPPTDVEALRVDALRGNFHAHQIKAGARRGAPFTLKGAVPGVSATTPTNNPTPHPLSVLATAALGGGVAGGYTTNLASGSTTTELHYTAGQANTAWGALAQLIPLSATRAIAWLMDVTAGTPDTATVALELPDTPASSGTVYGSAVSYLDKTPSATPFTVRWQGADTEACVDFVDCVVDVLKITLDPGKQPMFEATIRPGWFDSQVGDSEGAPGAYAISCPPLGAMVGRLGARLATADGNLPVDKCEVTITVDNKPVGSHSGQEGIARFVAADRKVELALTYAAADLTNWGNPGDDAGAIQIDCGVVPGAALSLLFPAAVIAERTQLGDSDGIASFTAKMEAGRYAGDGSDAGVAKNSSFRIAFL